MAKRVYKTVYITPEQYELAKKRGIPKTVLEQRVRLLGWTIEKALKKEYQKRQGYGNWAKVAGKNGISQNAFYARVRVMKWTPEQAATVPTMSKREAGKKAAEIRKLKRLEREGAK